MNNFIFVAVPRLVLGLIFLLGAADGFYFVMTGAHLIHPPTTDAGLEFEAALKATGFFWPLMKAVELIGAFCLLTNRAPALGLALLAPIMAVVVLFHIMLNPQGIALAIILTITGSMLAYHYRRQFMKLMDQA